MPGLATALVDLVDLVLPRRCVGCGAPAATLCTACRPGGAPFRVETDGAHGTDGVEVVAAAAYGDGIRRAIIAYKERGRRDLVAVLGPLLALAVHELVGTRGFAAGGTVTRVLLVAPPTTRAAAAERGGDHVLRLARSAARTRCGPGPPVRVLPAVVRSRRRVRDSAGLGIVERERNLAGSMAAAVPRVMAGTSVVVVDDVVTTGATIRETTRALRRAGWPVHGAAVVAATPRRLMADPLAGHGRPV